MGILSLVWTWELATKTKIARPQPAKKYAQGFALPAARLDFNFFQPRERQKGWLRRTLRVTERNRKIAAYQRILVPKRNCGLVSRERSRALEEMGLCGAEYRNRAVWIKKKLERAEKIKT